MNCAMHNSAAARGQRVAGRSRRHWRLRGLIAALALIVLAPAADAADLDDASLRGSYSNFFTSKSYSRWDGVNFGAHVGYSNLSADFTDSSVVASLSRSATTNSTHFGGFLGYNLQWDELVLGFDGAYNRPSSLNTSSTSGSTTASLKLVDYATFRGRAGYAFGQFLPYAFVGAAIGRLNYAITPAASASATPSRDNAYAAGFVAGLGIDVSILPNVFVRAEYEYVAFSPVGRIRSSLNSARAGIGVRF